MTNYENQSKVILLPKQSQKSSVFTPTPARPHSPYQRGGLQIVLGTQIICLEDMTLGHDEELIRFL